MKSKNIFWGLLFILGGAFLIVSKLGFLSDMNVLSIVLTVFLVALILDSIFRKSFADILFPLAFISIIYDEQLGITEITPWTVLLGALFGTIGLSMIFSKKKKWYDGKYRIDFSNAEKLNVEDESFVRHETAFASTIKYVNTDAFVQGDFKCTFGSMKIYFDHATMQNNSATVNLEAAFSGVELYVPRTWKIEDKMNVSFSGIELKNKGDAVTTNTLILTGSLSFSGIEVFYI